MKIIHGDLIALATQGKFDVIVHGCNCFCNMGAGIAKSVKLHFNEAYKADLATHKGDKKKLGTYSSALIVREKVEFTVINAYTQYEFGRGKTNANYHAIRDVFELIKRDFPGKRIGYPLIGAGLAGGNWDIIGPSIDAALAGEDHTLVKFTG